MTQSETTETSLKITHDIAAPVGRVWHALSDQETLKKWFCPGTRTCRLDHYEFREGGAFKLAFEPTEDDGFGGPSPAHGVFQQIVARQKVVMTWNWDFPDQDNGPESRLVLHLDETPKGTRVTLIHEGLPNKESVEGHQGGWQTVLPKLERLLA